MAHTVAIGAAVRTPDAATDVYFFAYDEGAGPGCSDGLPRVIRASFHENAPTVFITLEDATLSPPCAIRNDSSHALWFAVCLGRGKARTTSQWHRL